MSIKNLNSFQNTLFQEALYLSYQKKYNENKIYSDISLNLDKKNLLNLTIEKNKNNNLKSLNFYGNPIFLNNSDESIKLRLFEKFKKILNLYEIKEIIFKKELSLNEVEKISKKEFSNEIIVENYIDLNKSLDEIRKNFSKGHKHILNKDYKDLLYEVFDYKNYKKNQIEEMRELHKKVSGKVTRSIESWKVNEDMILNKKGFLIKVKENDNLISYSFIFKNSEEAIYFSSCTLRDKFIQYKNITHKSIWKCISYLKDSNCKKFHLGISKTLYSKKIVDQKRKNIERFKSSFGGEKKIFVIFDQLPINYKYL